MPKTLSIPSTLPRPERTAWHRVLAFVRHSAAAILLAGPREDIADVVLSEILSTQRLLALYLLAIGEIDQHAFGSRRKILLDQEIVRVAASTFVLAFVRTRAVTIATAGWRDNITDFILSQILTTPHLLTQYRLAIGKTDPHVRGSQRKAHLNRAIGRDIKSASNGMVRIVNGRKVMRDASVGPHFRFTVLDSPSKGTFVPLGGNRPRLCP